MKFHDLFTGEIKDTHSHSGRKGTCRCHHPRFTAGHCTYRTCTHNRSNHYGIVLEHDNDKLSEGDMILGKVEPMIAKHPEQFKELKALLDWIKVGTAKYDCGFPIRREDLQYYPNHDGGLHIPYENNRCWVFAHCPHCNYDYSFPKILNQKYEKR
jgi:hypothetical protein